MAKTDGLRTLALINASNRLIGYAQVLPEDHWTGPRTVQDGTGATMQIALRTNRPDLPIDGSIVYDIASGSFMSVRRLAELGQMRGLVGAPGGSVPSVPLRNR